MVPNWHIGTSFVEHPHSWAPGLVIFPGKLISAVEVALTVLQVQTCVAYFAGFAGSHCSLAL